DNATLRYSTIENWSKNMYNLNTKRCVVGKNGTIPAIIVENDNVDLGHEAKIGRISDEAIFYLMTRGISEEEARAMLVRGFVEPISKELPLEYAVEMNNLINLELEGSIG
ncbi:MAG: SufD family Fe-S cluster assembly protein, partial [Veillonella parvula]|nr:SufD family Fe-S cluster assembly protein [Veillonella parvula]